MSKVIPIIFNTEMVKAIQDGRKTQTRRPCKGVGNDNCITATAKQLGITGRGKFRNHIIDERSLFMSPFGKPGSILAVRETCRAVELQDGRDFIEYKDGQMLWPFENSEAGADEWIKMRHYRGGEGLWVPSIHCPMSAVRIKLEVKRVWVEGLQSIRGGEVHKEGVKNRSKFRDLWQCIYGTWEENPWVWCCEFELIELEDVLQ